ncbi:hypothetical protein OO013_05140 [Mangrovivirga sp. M17]|uniref:Outer membrane protein beta-barrel domain-containing protein n=1 Tax=Mangrovivirga halotolerans TaxID=2993936 RepID=A0ABT3RNX5_9BACT|nr:hypothetical protein [Mangrovivirga halotolerans]MCX2743238.1 hypothetical protein [Mangrovivirga halotolerans]
MKSNLHKPLVITILSLFFFLSNAQIQLSGGLTFSKLLVNSENLETKMRTGYFTGVSYRYKPEPLKSLSFSGGFIFSRRKHIIEQPFLEKRYYGDSFLTIPIIIYYDITPWLLINAGYEFGTILESDFSEKEYRNRANAILFGLNFLQNKKVSPFIRSGFNPSGRLEYQTFDDFGNKTGTTSEFKNFYILTGLIFNLLQ